MKAALLLVLSLSALALAGPAFNKNNQIDADKAQQHSQYMTQTTGDSKQTQAIETLKQWCFASQMSQPELTASFKKLVGIVKAQPEDQSTEAAVMSGRMCQGTLVQKSVQSGQTVASSGADAQAHELIKDAYMDALIACESRQCMQQLIKIINSQKVDSIRASYYMTRIAVSDKDSIKEGVEVKQLAESFLQSSPMQSGSEAVERQKLLAVTATLGKSLKEQQQGKQSELRQIAEQVAKTIVDRYVKPVSQQEVRQYQEQPVEQQSSQLIKKIAKRSAALKALANIPGWIIKECTDIEQTLVEIAQNKDELSTVRQSAIECLEQNDKVIKELKQITFDQQEPTEVRVAAYRALMTSAYAAGQMKSEQEKQQIASELVNEVVKHCEDQRNQQQDDQFVLYAISHLDNMRTTEQPEYEAIKECISKNKQHFMQIQVLCKKFKQQLNDVRKSSRNYKLEQEFNQLESGLIIEGDIVYESKQKQSQSIEALPKLVRVNMSMPVMGETINVVEITVRQNQMDEQLMGALNLAQNAKFNSESMTKIVNSFKQSVDEQQQQQQQRNTKKQQRQQQAETDQAEADLTIKVDGCTIVYLSVDDFKTKLSDNQGYTQGHQRNTRSIYSNSDSIVDVVIEHLKRRPVAFNRGFNFNINERLAKVLDVEANVIAGLRFESRAQGSSSDDFEIVAHAEPRFAFESIVGPAKVSSKKLLQRVSTKTALGLRLRYKKNELVDVQIDLPMNNMELFTVETQMVEQSRNSYTYLPNSIYGQEDIYTPDDEWVCARYNAAAELLDQETEQTAYYKQGIRKVKRSIFEKQSSTKSLVKSIFSGKQKNLAFAHSFETSEAVARATGLRGKVRVVASPADMGFVAQLVAEKYEPRMQGYRVQIHKSNAGTRTSEQKQYTLTLSTPGSRLDRTTQLRVMQSTGPQRTIVKSSIQSPQMGATAQVELIHDARQYGLKAEIVSSRGKQWRHAIECGLQRGSQSQSGRIATTVKPFMSLESSSLKRPIQMQAVISYQQEPKTVISYELKCPTSESFLQGKIIVDERGSSVSRAQWQRRSMQSPIDLLLRKDLTVTAELLGQLAEHTIKVHQMIDWDSDKWAVQADWSASHKNLRKSVESQVSAMLKLDQDQQMVTVQRKCPQNTRKEFRLQLVSDCKSPAGHQLVAECRYNGKRGANLNEIVSYKHKIDYNNWSQSKVDLGMQLELIASEQQFNEKLNGRTQAIWERNQKHVQTELSTRSKSAKFDMDWTSAEQHKFELALQGDRLGQHRTVVRASPYQASLQSQTQKYDGQTVNKFVVELEKPKDQANKGECKLLVELPTERAQLAVDLKLSPGKLSSWAVASPRFASKGEFAFETFAGRSSFGGKRFLKSLMPFAGMRLKTDLKDLAKQDAYWLESGYDQDKPWYVRASSPVYRADLEFEPSEMSSKIGVFAHNKRSPGLIDELYSGESATEKQLELSPNKLWAIRSIISKLPSGTKNELKQKAMQALLEYADRRQSHKHTFQYNPMESRFNFNLDASSNEQSWKPMRATGDISTQCFWLSRNCKVSPASQSNFQMESEWADLELSGKPFDGQEMWAKLNAVSRHPRSPFKKHESEARYQKDQGYKASMKHQDKDDKRHSWTLEANEQPKEWAKVDYESEKHGKAKWEHKWRKNADKRSRSDHTGYPSISKRSISLDTAMDQEDEIYANQIQFELESPRGLSQRTQMNWQEPIGMIKKSRYGLVDYLRHVNGRLNSRTHQNEKQLYNLDFDYQPQSSLARFNMEMPEDMMHSSSFEFDPSERLYKLSSRIADRRTNEPSYEFSASLKPTTGVYGLGGQEQEPVFFADSHPMLGGHKSGAWASIFKQPVKIDYSDRFGRSARLDYDHSPAHVAGNKYQGLRQKRAALYYKDQSNDFEHQSSYDFYPELMLGGWKQGNKRQPGDIAFKTQTKYGPIVMQVDSDESAAELKLRSPIVNVKVTSERAGGQRVGSAKLIKITIDNKQQNVPLEKLVRQSPILKKSELAKSAAKKIDSARFEHETELLVSIVDAIFKLKSQTLNHNSPVMQIEGELNQPQQKIVVKLNGKRTEAQLLVDLVQKSANWNLSVDNQRTVYHQTRVAQLNSKYFALESVTGYQQKPLIKVNAMISSKVFEEPSHLFSKRGSWAGAEEHISTFEATIFEPTPVQVSGQFDCARKEARINYKDLRSNKDSHVRVQMDDSLEEVYVDANIATSHGINHHIQKTFNVAPFIAVY